MHTAHILKWLTDHAVAILTLSVIVTVGGEQLYAAMGRRLDRAGTITSISGGVAYLVAKAVFSKALMFGVAMAVYRHRILDLDWTNPLVWFGVFVGRDFAYYWIHRAEHRVRVLWASHMIHHSLERFTFTSAVRLPWMESLYKPVLVLWVPLIGFHPVAFAAMGAFVLMAGQLQHTELGRRTTVLDAVFVTPSAHRVHHGSNAEYIDRNFGSMLIIWDRIFGTYSAETVPVVYGLAGTKRVMTPKQALVGGYPELAAALSERRGFASRSRYLLHAP